jgi:SAM-dependent methyltransferase
MTKLTSDDLATIEFKAQWEHDGIQHTDVLWAQRVNMWRDLLPPALNRQLQDAHAGDAPSIDLVGDGLAPPYQTKNVRKLPVKQLLYDGRDRQTIIPRYGRFYPAGLLGTANGAFKESIVPFRCISVNERGIEADLNHPMASRNVKITAALRDVREKFEERGGTSNAWVERLLDGPGLKARANGRATDFFSDNPFARGDAGPDSTFYARPRMVNHIDETAILYLTRLYDRLVPAGGRVLDLMSSWVSHLPGGVTYNRVAGLGMNRDELAANPLLSDFTVHDLNHDPSLPYRTGDFDAVICNVSVEYLTRPFDVFKEVGRVLDDDGVFVVTFSNRWFPPKAIRIWTELHEFERVGLVTEYFLDSGLFDRLETWSIRGLPRPVNDRYYRQQPFSDPMYAVWGRKRKTG